MPVMPACMYTLYISSRLRVFFTSSQLMQSIAIRQFTSVTAKLSAAAFLRLHDPKFSIQASTHSGWQLATN